MIRCNDDRFSNNHPRCRVPLALPVLHHTALAEPVAPRGAGTAASRTGHWPLTTVPFAAPASRWWNSWW